MVVRLKLFRKFLNVSQSPDTFPYLVSYIEFQRVFHFYHYISYSGTALSSVNISSIRSISLGAV